MANDRLELCENTAETRGGNQATSKTKESLIQKYVQSQWARFACKIYRYRGNACRL